MVINTSELPHTWLPQEETFEAVKDDGANGGTSASQSFYELCLYVHELSLVEGSVMCLRILC